jgi:RHS repeat-associated protein
VRLDFDTLLSAIFTAAPLAYEETFIPGTVQKRLIEHVRTQYRPDDLGASQSDPLALLPAGQLESMALPGETYKMAFSPGLLMQLFGDKLNDGMLADEGRYVHSQGDANWWLRSGRAFLSPDTTDDAAAELAHARAHFFLPRRFRDPFHRPGFETESVVAYDTNDLAFIETRDALGNIVQVSLDYRVLQPRLMTDPNGNRAEVAFDALGMVVGTALMGKATEAKGDTLQGFVADLDYATALAHLDNPLADPQAILQRAGTRLVYDLFAYSRTRDEPQPAVVYALARETHDADLIDGEQTRVQHSVSYSDGFGREIQKKLRAEPGPLTEGGEPVAPRWIGSGWTVFNNKGKPVRQYEPFFTGTHHFEFDVRQGVSPILCYDPAQRVIATLNPNHTWQKVVFDPWRQETWDVNDTVMVTNPADDPDVGGLIARLPEADYLPTWYSERITGAMGSYEQAAAAKAAVHAGTPSVVYLDSLGRTFLTVAHNRLTHSDTPPAEPPEEAFHRARVVFDIEGNQREVIDALDRIVMRYDYDMLSHQVHPIGMEAGERWALGDVAGRPIRAWDSRGHAFRNQYDVLGRPVGKFVMGSDAAQSDPRVIGREVMFEKTEYGEGEADDIALNLRTRVLKLYDTAGVVTNEAYDFKGNLLRGSRQLTSDYKAVPDWSADVMLDPQSFASSATFDALNRATTSTAPDGSVTRPAYNEANLLERIDVNLRGETTNGEPVWTPFITDIDYNAKGQRELIVYGNGARTEYTYDPLTFRLTRLKTFRDPTDFPDDCPASAPADWPGCGVQDLRYTYDPANNITHIQDDAQQTIYFRNKRVDPGSDYTYDALYQLIEATGREHLGQNADGTLKPPTPPDVFDGYHAGLFQPGDGNAMGRYLERYVYDLVGNFLTMQHRGADPANPGWTRSYTYEETSLIETGKVNNRLTSTQIGNGLVERYTYDAHGSMTTMLHLPLMQLTFLDQLRASAWQVFNSGTPETTYYVYDAAGQRARKVTERQAASGEVPRRLKERIYLGGFETYREYDGDGTAVALERETLHVMDDKQRVTLVETRTSGDDGTAARLIRYQIGNHLGSACVELDETGRVISYEEYLPYGSTSYQAMDSSIAAAAKRYRYTGMERDEETGFSYRGARYYIGGLARWCSADPSGVSEDLNVYRYVRNNPTVAIDPSGRAPVLGLLLLQSDNRFTQLDPTKNKPMMSPENVNSFWNGGGNNLVIGAIMVTGGAIIIIGTGGAATPFVLVTSAMAIGGGEVGIGAGGAELVLRAYGLIDEKQAAELNRTTGDVMLAASPGGLAGAFVGAAATGKREGAETGAAVGGLLEFSVSAVKGLRSAVGEGDTGKLLFHSKDVEETPAKLPSTTTLVTHGNEGTVKVYLIPAIPVSFNVPVRFIARFATSSSNPDFLIASCCTACDAEAMQELANATGKRVGGYTFTASFPAGTNYLTAIKMVEQDVPVIDELGNVIGTKLGWVPERTAEGDLVIGEPIWFKSDADGAIFYHALRYFGYAIQKSEDLKESANEVSDEILH